MRAVEDPRQGRSTEASSRSWASLAEREHFA
jgi:hypothetical protein